MIERRPPILRTTDAAINPVNPMPHKTRFHELAHVLLGHTAEGTQADGEITPRNLWECEAEAVALPYCAALELPGVDHCRGYIQAWWGAGHPIPERSAQRILKAADRDLDGGLGAPTDTVSVRPEVSKGPRSLREWENRLLRLRSEEI